MEAGGCVCIVCVQHELCMTEATLLEYNNEKAASSELRRSWGAHNFYYERSNSCDKFGEFLCWSSEIS